MSSLEPVTPTLPKWWRPALGAFALASGTLGLIILSFINIPHDNQQAVNIGIGVILGWGTAVVQSEFGGSAAGRRMAERMADKVN